jgi:NAD(P)-dependent dehydrogenase (short-subunit alcohol dehydrogenase family)
LGFGKLQADSEGQIMGSTLFNLDGQRILITGSNGGIGLEIARGLAQHGANVILNGRDTDKLEAAAERLRSDGHTVESMKSMPQLLNSRLEVRLMA